MKDANENKMLLPEAGIPGFTPVPKKDEDIIGEYRESVIHGEHGLQGDKTGLSEKLTFVVVFVLGAVSAVDRELALTRFALCEGLSPGFALALVFLKSSLP